MEMCTHQHQASSNSLRMAPSSVFHTLPLEGTVSTMFLFTLALSAIVYSGAETHIGRSNKVPKIKAIVIAYLTLLYRY